LLPSTEEGGRPTAIKIRPTRLGVGPGGTARKGFMLLCRCFESAMELDETALRVAYGLTASEARVCAALVTGQNIHTLSQTLCISPQTARTHLKRIYDKTATVRLPELTRLLMTFAFGKTAISASPGARQEFAIARTPDRNFPFGL
jgi:DNA-binding CsgD family transcriptional regulator